MLVYRIRNLKDYLEYRDKTAVVRKRCREIEHSLLPKWRKSFRITGWSYTASRQVDFRVDSSRLSDGAVNWREQLFCPVSNLNNRMRAAIQFFDMECSPCPDDRIYISEQVTQLFGFVNDRYGDVTGSEYLGSSVAPGSTNKRGVRNEDLTRLSFPPLTFDHMLSFDCLEHIPDYRKVLIEAYRVLKQGGRLVLSAPFICSSMENLQRARMLHDGSVEHILPPEYHGDPLSRDGCLSYWVFGWELLDDLREAGFSDVYAMLYWSRDFGYIGEDQVLFVAKKQRLF